MFTGDSGTSEPSRPSRRYGVEWARFYRPAKWITLDADFARSHARFREHASEGDYIPSSIAIVVTAGVSVKNFWRSAFAGARLEYSGPRALIEDNAQHSNPTTQVTAQVGYKFNARWSVMVDVLNALNARSSDIDYYYPARLPGEPAEGIADIHTHLSEPRSA